MITENSQKSNPSEPVSENQKLLNNSNNNNNKNTNINSDNSESKKLSNKTILKTPRDLVVRVEDKIASNATTVLNSKDRDYLSSMKSIKSSEFNSTMSLNTKQASIRKNKSPFSRSTCYLLNQYVTYMILCLVIILGSFAYYYLNMSINLKVEDMEKRLNKRLFNNMQMKLYLPDDENISLDNMEEIDLTKEESDQKEKHNHDKKDNFIPNKKNSKSLKLFMSKTYSSPRTYFVLKQFNQSDFKLTPINLDIFSQIMLSKNNSEINNSSTIQDSFNKPKYLSQISNASDENDLSSTLFMENKMNNTNSNFLFKPVEDDVEDSDMTPSQEIQMVMSNKANSVKSSKETKKSKLRHRKRLGKNYFVICFFLILFFFSLNIFLHANRIT